VCIVAFCVLTSEFPTGTFEAHWGTPWHYVADVLFAPIPGIRLWYLDGIFLALWFAARLAPGASRGIAKPMTTAILLSMGTLLAWGVLGTLRGGSVIDMRLQLHTVTMVYLVSFMMMSALRTPDHFRMLGKAIVAAALFRALMIFLFYVLVMRTLPEYIATITDHGDSITFVTAIVLVLADAIHARDKKATWRALVIIPILVFAIHMNNRRLAWVGLIGSLLVVYFLLPSGKIRRNVHRKLLWASPFIAAYVVAGWGKTTGIWKPLSALQSMGPSSNDPSTESRNIENMGLIVTLQTSRWTGTGFGHQYIEVSSVYSAGVVFPQYRYCPHNSVLGLAAFTGMFGMLGIWLVFPVAAYLAARSYRGAQLPLHKTMAMATVAEVWIHMNQLYGDIGLNAWQGLVIMSGGFAAAARLPHMTGIWVSPTVKTEAPSPGK